jgi:aryl-alcohol dehydrogenase-like predicted oxidoreductase
MKYKILGYTGLKVSTLCLGTMNYGGKGFFSYMGNLDQNEVDQQIQTAIDAGVNFIDTANIYSEGNSEVMIGHAIKNLGINRDDLILATQVRGSYPLTPIEETIQTLEDLVRNGKIRYFGASNIAAWQLMKGLAYSQYNYLDRFVSLQVNYSLDVRDAEHKLVPLLRDQKVGMMVWSPLSGGLLTGKYKRGEQKEEGRLKKFPFPPFHEERAYDILDVLTPMAVQKQVSISQLALAWLLHQPVVSSIIIGATKITQLQDNLKSVDVEFSKKELIELNEVSKLPAEYPVNVLEIMTKDRNAGPDFLNA